MKLVILQSYKTKKGEIFTKQAIRQREIIYYLRLNKQPRLRTRVGICKYLNGESRKKVWNNLYSAIYRDIADVLIPKNLIQQEGILTTKRGPKALQEQGIPYYKITEKGEKLITILNKIDYLQTKVKEQKNLAEVLLNE